MARQSLTPAQRERYRREREARFRKLSQELQDLLGQVPEEVQQQALMDAGFDVLGRAMRLAPVDTGHLRESGWLEVNGVEMARGQEDGGVARSAGSPPLAQDRATARVTFNATTEDGRWSYAVIQHERTDFKHERGGEAKYLEKAMVRVAYDFRRNLRKVIQRLMQRRAR